MLFKSLTLTICAISLLAASPCLAKLTIASDINSIRDQQDVSQSQESFKNPFKNSDLSFFPVPVFETSPDEGQSYGVMPVLLFSDKDSKAISLILAAIGQWNEIAKWSGAAVSFYYPNPVKNPDEVFEFYFEYAQRYYRETTLRYFNPHLLDKFYLLTKFIWLKTPFPRFYGFGSNTPKSAESNYVSRNFLFDTTFGYYLTKNIRINLTETFTTTDVLDRAFDDVADTLTLYGSLPEVKDSTDLIHKVSLTFDSRPIGMNSKKGTFLEGSYFFSHKNLGADTNLNGFSFEAIQLFSWWKERTTTALRVFVQDMYGDSIPFYLQSNLGGNIELRSYIPNRFTDTGKIIFTLEQRVRIFAMNIFGVPAEFYADPFFEVGRVFHHINNLGWDDVQPVGGIGFRGVVPPNVVGRLDIAYGKEGFGVYTMLDYPF